MKVIKRNGDSVNFSEDKIFDAINKAADETELGVDYELARKISSAIKKELENVDFTPNVEHIQDIVEDSLMQSDRRDIAKTFILYREERNKLRDQGWEMTELQRDIYEKKYKLGNETFDQFLDRVSGGNQPIKKAIRDKKFLPAGRILAGRGMEHHGKKVTLSNCYVVPKVEDSIESIFDTAKYLAKTYSYGGGVGLNISNLRPRGARVQNSADTTTGATSFMDLYSMVTGLIGQKGRRGALMLNINVQHPDIEEFIDIKNQDEHSVRFANISVNINDEFMRAVENDEEYELYFKVGPTGEEIKKVVNARDLFIKLAKNNWNMAEPGILFWDKIDSWHLMSGDPEFEFAGVNPCAEEPLPPWGSCNLASINLSEFVKNPFSTYAEFDYDGFAQMARDGVIFLNEVLDENMDNHPLEQQKEVSRDLRQIGLGIMGLADMLIKMNIRYGDEDSLRIIENIGEIMLNTAVQQSSELAKKEGSFPRYKYENIIKSKFYQENLWDDTKQMIKENGLRNSQLLTIAPTGSISTMIGTSGGVEPIFQISYTRKSETLHKGDTYYKVFTPIAKKYMTRNNITEESELPKCFITSGELDYAERIDVQAVWQKYIDASISSTVNLPEETTVEEVAMLYQYAWEKGLKGVTIFRDGCNRGAILITEKDKDKTKVQELQEQLDALIADTLLGNPDQCPMCGGKMNHTGGCDECQDCGYSPCSI